MPCTPFATQMSTVQSDWALTNMLGNVPTPYPSQVLPDCVAEITDAGWHACACTESICVTGEEWEREWKGVVWHLLPAPSIGGTCGT